MKDFRDIDAFFNGQKPFEEKSELPTTSRVRVLHFLKLIMPSVAAVLVALILLFPILKKNTVIADIDVTLPKTGELEKLHIERTEFTVTDKENKVSTFTADQIDETEPGSKLMKITNPKGKISTGTDEAFVYVDSDVGYYNQQDNIVTTEQNVKAVYDDGTTVLTESADYNFNTAVGSGTEDVYAYGDWGRLWAEGFEYRQSEGLLILSGQSKIITDGREMTAQKELRYYRLQNRMEAEGNVRMSERDNVLYTDKLVTYFKKNEPSKIEKAEAFGHVVVKSPKGTAEGDYGLYLPDKDEIELVGNVRITQDGNVIYGQKALTNLQTSISRISADKKTGRRVSGIIRGSSVKGKKNEKK